jgi:hypothetical protein
MFLQCPDVVSEQFRPRARDAHLGEEILLDSIEAERTSITFHACLPKHALKGCQSYLPRGDGALSAIQLPLSSKKMPFQFNSHRMGRRRNLASIRSRLHEKEESLGKHRHRVNTRLANGAARLGEASILAQWDGDERRSR